MQIPSDHDQFTALPASMREGLLHALKSTHESVVRHPKRNKDYSEPLMKLEALRDVLSIAGMLRPAFDLSLPIATLHEITDTPGKGARPLTQRALGLQLSQELNRLARWHVEATPGLSPSEAALRLSRYSAGPSR